jgi:hypothetical protein
VAILLRDRPFNLKGGYGFLFRSEFFFRTTRELEYLFFLSRKARIFFPEFHIRLYDKNSESDYFVLSPPESEYFFSNIGNQNIFLEKNHTQGRIQDLGLGGVSRGGVWGPLKVPQRFQDRALVGGPGG